MESARELFEVRAELKKFRHMNPKRVLQILKSLRECNLIDREWIRKTRVTKTLQRISQHKFNENDEIRILITKLSKYLVGKYRTLFPKLPPAPSKHQETTTATSKSTEASKTHRPVSAADVSTPVAVAVPQPQELPVYDNSRRNQGLSGFVKYFQKNLDEKQLSQSITICIAIEHFLHSRNIASNTGFNEDTYKNDVKKLCTLFLDKDNSSLLKAEIIAEYAIVQNGELNCIKHQLA